MDDLDRLREAVANYAEPLPHVYVVAALERIAKLETALRNAPMPYRESTLAESWDDYYYDWWTMNASEEALNV